MALRYHYNPETCRYEPIVVAPRVFFKKTFRFLGTSLLIGLAGLLYFNYKYPFIDESHLIKENQNLKAEWQVINSQLQKTSDQLAALEDNDDNNFRVILGMEPLSPSQREAGVGGREKASAEIPYSLIRNAIDFSEKIKNRLTLENNSMNELKDQLLHNEKQWAARPAIQPISNKDLIHLYTTFGPRLHPILGEWADHLALDFAAKRGTPIYATGDGYVDYASGGTTYGNVVFINHGYRYQTRYAHMSKYIVAVGQRIKRGQVIGYVGNTGQSKGDHLHYEVLIGGTKVNPIHFFQLDLNSREFEKLISLAKTDEALD
ncbi:MAG: M23 family metallopeptidase [Bacteroidetes bacterium]|nr:M23 family metallopeptidase [Bacteroidota bacterium]